MIIQRRANEYLFITQGAHAALAGDIMTDWRLGGLPAHPRRAPILTATRRHDDGWEEEDAELHVGEQGEALDFISVPAAVKHRIWPRATDRLAGAPYVAALVAQHAILVHGPLRDDPAWRGFFREMEERRDALLGRSRVQDLDTLAGDYAFVRTGDLLSLIFCNGWSEAMPGNGYHAILKGITLEIAPDPFAGRQIPLSVEARVLPVRSYATAADLRQAYAAAPVTEVHGVATGS